VPGSYDRKGAGRFLKDRLIRLGIPLAIYSWIIDPLLGYVRDVWLEGPRMFYWSDLVGHFWDGSLIGSGPLLEAGAVALAVPGKRSNRLSCQQSANVFDC
jgi:hypothetical protein